MSQSADATFLHEDNAALIFSPLKFRNLEVKNRLFRSNLSGMFDEYNGYGGKVEPGETIEALAAEAIAAKAAAEPVSPKTSRPSPAAGESAGDRTS